MKTKGLFSQIADYVHTHIWSHVSAWANEHWAQINPQLIQWKQVTTDPVFILTTGTGVGFIQIFQYRAELTIALMHVVIASFLMMSTLGIVKHWKEGTADGKEFLKKTVIQFVVALSVVLLGYISAIVTNIVIQLADEVLNVDIPRGATLYWIFAGYMIVLAYHVLKSFQFINYLIPEYLPKWFTSGYERFAKTGKMSDLLRPTSDEAEDCKSA